VHYAIISCVHANLEALSAVVEDATRRGVEQIVCIGDIVGFGPDPTACVDLVRRACGIALRGCHDEAVVAGGAHLPPATRAGLAWAKEQLGDERLAWMKALPDSYEAGGIVFCHASPREYVTEYLFPEDVRRDARKLARAFDKTAKVVFVGHTHIPGVFQENPIRWTPASQLENYFHYKKGDKVIVNVGSVGQPRDGDPRACYLEVNKNEMYWRRLDYDVNQVVAKIQSNERLTTSTAQRLLRGL
jgi:diadenosine tetraphosphatase ApaH/serine/threonine PP2A family protein phosphatase